MQIPALARGPLGHTLASRHGGHATGHEPVLRIESRQALLYTLSKAAELEHLIICQYLYAAYSLKRDASEGLPEELVQTVNGWARTLLRIAEQEMLHLALVQNLLTAIGAGPHFARPNFPVPPRAFPAHIQIALLPFGEEALRHFAFLERPEGEPVNDAEAFAALAEAQPLPDVDEDQIGPIVADFETISHLYRSIDDGLETLTERLGEAKLFIGPPSAQATGEHFRFKELIAVTDLVSAKAAIETIVEQGEGARGEWQKSHFGRLLSVLDGFLTARAAYPEVEFARPVLRAHVRPVESGAVVPLISSHFTVRATDLLNATYEVVLQSDIGFSLMEECVSPLGELLTRLPIGPEHPGRTVGPAFELFYDADWLLPHRDAAWQLIGERLNELADFSASCRDECPPGHIQILVAVSLKLREQADRIAAVA
jgi:Ferritin-like